MKRPNDEQIENEFRSDFTTVIYEDKEEEKTDEET